MVALAARKDEEQPGLTGLNKTFMAELGREVRGGVNKWQLWHQLKWP